MISTTAKRLFMVAAISTVLLSALGATSALAGYKFGSTVTVGTTYAMGHLSAARNSADNTQYIYCTSSTAATYINAYCIARNSAGTTGSCTINTPSSPAMLQLLSHLHGDSFLYFSWDASGYCNNLQVNNESHSPPKNP